MVLAKRGLRETDDARGPETIEDEALKAALRARARGVWIKTFAVAAIGTAIATLTLA